MLLYTCCRRALTLAMLGIVVAGCGGEGDDDGGSDAGARTGDSTSTTEETTAEESPTTISEPDTDPDLVADLGEAGDELTRAGCTFGTFDEEEPEHVSEESELDFASFPPSSGTHYGDWAPFGQFDEPVDDGFVVHNLEHGGVAVWLGSEVDEATTTAIADLLDDEEKWLVAPRSDIEGLYSAAWAKGLSCPPEALDKLGPDGTAAALDAWYEAVESTGSDQEKELPAYAGSMKEPAPSRDISAETPF